MGLRIGQVAGRSMRLNLHYPAQSEAVIGLRPESGPARDGRAVYQSRVRDVRADLDVFKPGKDNRKLGDVVEKGALAGARIYSLTLEERATCPRHCPQWLTCYGNSMNFAIRFKAGPALEAKIGQELRILNRRKTLIRLHTLGDFYSVEYVRRWQRWLQLYPNIHVFGYTAHFRDSTIGHAIETIGFERFAIRFSSDRPGPRRAIVLDHAAAPRSKNVILCPVETGKTRACATCGLCWAPAARRKTIGFILHGAAFQGRRPR